MTAKWGTLKCPRVLLEKEGFRFVTVGLLAINDKPDYRLQKKDFKSDRWKDVYLFDNADQCLIAMDDIEYAKLLNGEPAYIKKED